MSEQMNLRESDVKEFIIKELGVNPRYVTVNQMWSSDEFWVKIPVGLTERNIKSLSSRLKILMIIPTKIEHLEGLYIQVREIKK